MAKYMMALDAGTTSNRCILFNEKGEICSVAQEEFTQYYPQPGWVEHDAKEIWHTQLSVARQAMEKLGVTAADIAGIGITNQRETTIVWDKNTGEPVFHAIVWQCRRTSEYADSLKEKGLTDKFREKTGLVIDAYFSGTKIKWILDNVDGARDAVDDLAKKGVTVNLTYNASADSSQVDEQINILNQALAKQPNAILIAACDSGALDEQMITARDAGIPVIAYDITFDNAPECSLTATSASDSILAAGQAADELLKNETVVEKIKAATPENPAVFSVIAPDAIMTVHRDRTSGFANRMYELCQEWQPGAVAITGNDAFAKDSEKDPAVIIRTDIAASRADEDIRNLAQSVVSDSSVLAIFCVNEASATGILSATSDGLDLDRTNGKYKDLIVIGFDSGSTLNNAVRSGYFYGAVAQDPYTMGYEAMMMAVNVLQGGEASDIVIPAVWFDASNMDDPEISRILYD